MKSGIWAIATGVLAAVFLAIALWPQPTETQPLVVAARDLGAGTVLRAADLEIRQVPAPLPSTDALGDPASLLGRTLSVVRFAGETVTPLHLGAAVPLASHERGIAVRVATDSGLAGLLQPGQRVGLVAVVSDWQGQNEFGYAKALIENVRVLWVSPNFRLRPATFLPDSELAESPNLPREGLVVLAASIQPAPIIYETQRTLQVRAIRRALDAEAAAGDPTELAESVDVELLREELPQVIWGVPLEMIAALNHAGSSFTLVLQPPVGDPFTTPGFSLERLLVPLRPQLQVLEEEVFP